MFIRSESAERWVDFSRIDVDSAKFDRQPSCQHVHRLLGKVKAFEGNVYRRDVERRVTVGDFVTRAACRRIPTCHGVRASEIGVSGEGTESGVALGHETVLAVGASDSRQGEGWFVVRGVVRESFYSGLCKGGENEREGSDSERRELHGGG